MTIVGVVLLAVTFVNFVAVAILVVLLIAPHSSRLFKLTSPESFPLIFTSFFRYRRHFLTFPSKPPPTPVLPLLRTGGRSDRQMFQRTARGRGSSSAHSRHGHHFRVTSELRPLLRILAMDTTFV